MLLGIPPKISVLSFMGYFYEKKDFMESFISESSKRLCFKLKV